MRRRVNSGFKDCIAVVPNRFLLAYPQGEKKKIGWCAPQWVVRRLFRIPLSKILQWWKSSVHTPWEFQVGNRSRKNCCLNIFKFWIWNAVVVVHREDNDGRDGRRLRVVIVDGRTETSGSICHLQKSKDEPEGYPQHWGWTPRRNVGHTRKNTQVCTNMLFVYFYLLQYWVTNQQIQNTKVPKSGKDIQHARLKN